MLLTDVRNLTSEPDLVGVTELFRQQLGQSALFNLIDTDAVRQALFTMTLQKTTDLSSVAGEEVAWRLKAQAVVFWSRRACRRRLCDHAGVADIGGLNRTRPRGGS